MGKGFSDMADSLGNVGTSPLTQMGMNVLAQNQSRPLRQGPPSLGAILGNAGKATTEYRENLADRRLKQKEYEDKQNEYTKSFLTEDGVYQVNKQGKGRLIPDSPKKKPTGRSSKPDMVTMRRKNENGEIEEEVGQLLTNGTVIRPLGQGEFLAEDGWGIVPKGRSEASGARFVHTDDGAFWVFPDGRVKNIPEIGGKTSSTGTPGYEHPVEGEVVDVDGKSHRVVRQTNNKTGQIRYIGINGEEVELDRVKGFLSDDKAKERRLWKTENRIDRDSQWDTQRDINRSTVSALEKSWNLTGWRLRYNSWLDAYKTAENPAVSDYLLAYAFAHSIEPKKSNWTDDEINQSDAIQNWLKRFFGQSIRNLVRGGRATLNDEVREVMIKQVTGFNANIEAERERFESNQQEGANRLGIKTVPTYGKPTREMEDDEETAALRRELEEAKRLFEEAE